MAMGVDVCWTFRSVFFLFFTNRMMDRIEYAVAPRESHCGFLENAPMVHPTVMSPDKPRDRGLTHKGTFKAENR